MPPFPADPSPASDARRLIRDAQTAVLSTLHRVDADGPPPDATGWPFGSLVLTACTPEGVPILLLSDLAQHTQNSHADSRVSLLYDDTAQCDDPLTGQRATLLGRIVPAHSQDAEHFLAQHPEAAAYAQFRDFAFYRVLPESCHLVAGFGKIDWIAQDDLLAPPHGQS